MALIPRVVVITRPSEYTLLLRRHGTHGQARFFLEGRGQDIQVLVDRHERLEAARRTIVGAIPRDWRRSAVSRADLDRFLFEPDDIVAIVGQDGLVANVAKYLDGQHVIGVNPDPTREAGVLVPHTPAAGAAIVVASGKGASFEIEARTMVEATLDDGQRLLALNEVFIGQSTHQSARYRLRLPPSGEERQSSSGVIVSSGTGATGWASSIHRCHKCDLCLPSPADGSLIFFVREAWPSPATGTDLVEGLITPSQKLEVISEMNDTGVIFGDGIEEDALHFGWGQSAFVGRAERALHLVRA